MTEEQIREEVLRRVLAQLHETGSCETGDGSLSCGKHTEPCFAGEAERSSGEDAKRSLMGCALLIGREPTRDLGWRYVRRGEYEAVVIGSLSPAELLGFPDGASLEALLLGKPVYLWEAGLEHRTYSRTANRALYAKLLAAERQLKLVGVRFVGQREQKLLTAREVRSLLEKGLPVEGRLTPLARDVLEGKA